MPNYILQSKLFLKFPITLLYKQIIFYWSLISLFSMRNIAANHYMTGMDGFPQRRTIQETMEALKDFRLR